MRGRTTEWMVVLQRENIIEPVPHTKPSKGWYQTLFIAKKTLFSYFLVYHHHKQCSITTNPQERVSKILLYIVDQPSPAPQMKQTLRLLTPLSYNELYPLKLALPVMCLSIVDSSTALTPSQDSQTCPV
jgi:hypothetical protein